MTVFKDYSALRSSVSIMMATSSEVNGANGPRPKALRSRLAASRRLQIRPGDDLVALIRERPDYQNRGPERIFGAFQDVFSNRHAQKLLFVFTVQT